MPKKISKKIILIVVFLAIFLLGLWLFWAIWPGFSRLSLVDCAKDFFAEGEHVIFQSEIDIDGGDKKELAIATFNEEAKDSLGNSCRGYCDESYILRLIKRGDDSDVCREIYREAFTKEENGSLSDFVVRDLNSDGKEEFLFRFSFVRITETNLLAFVNDQIKKIPIGQGGAIKILESGLLEESQREISGNMAEQTGCRIIVWQWTGRELKMLSEKVQIICP